MATKILNYYILKEAQQYINLNTDLDITEKDIFKYALLLSTDEFYTFFKPFKINKYNITSKMLDNRYFNDFFKEALSRVNNIDMISISYHLLGNYIINKHINNYVNSITLLKNRTQNTCNSIDAYFFEKMENKKIYQVDLSTYYRNTFDITIDDLELLEFPTKKVLGFFCFKNYYDKCYKNIKKYLKSHTKNFLFIKKLFHLIYDLFNHRKNNLKAKYFIYPKNYSIRCLNLTKKAYTYQNQTYDYSINEIYDNILNEIKIAYTNLNHYYNGDKDRFLNYLKTI